MAPEVTVERSAVDAALSSMTKNVSARLDVKSRKSEFTGAYAFPSLNLVDDIPESFFRQMTSCQTAANEFLRQFWSATYPPMSEAQNIAVATTAQRAAKATRMIGYLSKTHEKVGALLRTAQQQGLDHNRIEAVSITMAREKMYLIYRQAMKPVVNAVDRALTFHRTKTQKARA